MSLEEMRAMPMDDLVEWLAFFQLKDETRQKDTRKQAIRQQRTAR